MLNTLDELEGLLINSPLASRAKHALRILDTGETALFVATNSKHALADWMYLRQILAQTGRWPVLVSDAGCRNWPHASMFSRDPFEEEPDLVDLATPRAIVAASHTIDLDHWQQQCQTEFGEYRAGDSWEDQLEYMLSPLLKRGAAPTREEIRAAMSESSGLFPLDRFLFDWSEQHLGPQSAASVEMNWFDPAPNKQAVLLLPTVHGCDALAYMHWWGYNDTLSRIQLLRHWQDKFGAELVAHWDTMLQFIVQRPPQTSDEAFSLAVQHYWAAPCTLDLPGERLYQYAESLLHSKRWFLHERP